MSTNSTHDPFESDEIRRRFAARHELEGLHATYVPGALPELNDVSSAKLWNELASYAEVPDFRLRRLQAVAQLVPAGSKILDVGVGWGEIIGMLRKAGKCEYVGIDFSEEMVGAVSRKHPDCRFYIGGLEQINEDFDVVLALEICEHILPTKIFALYEQIRRVLRAHGRLIVSVPVYENLRAATLSCPECGHRHNRMGHVRSYTPELIAAELKLAGFTVLKSFLIYARFGNSLAGRVKRLIENIGRLILGLDRSPPLNVVLLLEKIRDNPGPKKT